MPATPTEEAPQPSLSQRVGGLLAALGLVVALMIALPLVQLLQHQHAHARALAAAQAWLDPLAQAVGVQRALLAHRDAAAIVLTGDDTFEPERQLRQQDVDEQLSALANSLLSGQWQLARQEADALRTDWRVLASHCAGRSLAASESHQAHRLLVEQTLQVIDLLDAAGVPHGAGTLQPASVALATAKALPRLAWKLAVLGESRQPAEAAQTTLLDAQFEQFQRAHAEATQQLAAQLAAVQLHTGWLVIGMLALAAGALRLGFAVATPLAKLLAQEDRTRSPVAPSPAADVPASLPQQHAGALMDRLREGHASSDRTKRDPQTATPPPP